MVPEQMVVVAVGDREKIEPELKKLNLGPIEIREPDGTIGVPAVGRQNRAPALA